MRTIQVLVSPEVSKLNQVQQKEKRLNAVWSDYKKENAFIQPIIPVDGLCYKMG